MNLSAVRLRFTRLWRADGVSKGRGNERLPCSELQGIIKLKLLPIKPSEGQRRAAYPDEFSDYARTTKKFIPLIYYRI